MIVDSLYLGIADLGFGVLCCSRRVHIAHSEVVKQLDEFARGESRADSSLRRKSKSPLNTVFGEAVGELIIERRG